MCVFGTWVFQLLEQHEQRCRIVVVEIANETFTKRSSTLAYFLA